MAHAARAYAPQDPQTTHSAAAAPDGGPGIATAYLDFCRMAHALGAAIARQVADTDDQAYCLADALMELAQQRGTAAEDVLDAALRAHREQGNVNAINSLTAVSKDAPPPAADRPHTQSFRQWHYPNEPEPCPPPDLSASDLMGEGRL